jgi:hypothetical protein
MPVYEHLTSETVHPLFDDVKKAPSLSMLYRT